MSSQRELRDRHCEEAAAFGVSVEFEHTKRHQRAVFNRGGPLSVRGLLVDAIGLPLAD
jgi:hypothetical protein